MNFSVGKWKDLGLKYTLFLRNVANHHTARDVLTQNVYESLNLG